MLTLRSSSRILPPCLAAAIIGGAIAPAAGQNETRTERTDLDLNALRARIAQLEAQAARQALRIESLQQIPRVHPVHSESSGPDETRDEELRALVHEVMRDAEGRTSLLNQTDTAGWDNGFYLTSPDGHFYLRVLGQVQFRYVWSHQENSGGDDDRAGFENTRTRFGFKGHVGDPSWQYFIWATAGGTSSVLDIWIQKDLGDGWAVQAGQFKLPNWREWVISETSQQFVERSVLDARYRSLYSQGVQWRYARDDFRMQGAFSDGLQSFNNGFNVSTANSNLFQAQTEYALTGRVEFLFGEAATWSSFADFESWPDGPRGGLVGASIHYQIGEFGDATIENEILQWSVDGAVELGGANLFAGLIGTHVENDAGLDRDELGLLLQAGFFLTDDLELLARWEWGDLDGAGVSGEDHLNIMTVGLSRFWSGHSLKWTTDVGYAFEPVDSAWGGAARGWRADAPGEDGQFVIRSQFNLLF